MLKGLRQYLAARTPARVRKLVRMAEHYARRHREWGQVLIHMSGGDGRSRRILIASAISAPLTSLRRLDGYEPPALLGDVRLDVAGVGAFEIRRRTDDILHVLTAREPHVRAEIERRLRAGSVFVDAGANIGFYSILAARLVGSEGRVFAVEMMPQTARQLRRHVALNAAASVDVIERALSNREDEPLSLSYDPEKLGQASIVTAKGGSSVCVQTATLDRLLADLPVIDLIKMDLEGAEYQALGGARQVLSRTEALIYESNQRDHRIVSLLEEIGFRVRPLMGHDYLAERVRPA